MSEYKDFSDMIEIVTTATEIQGRTGDFFRRHARLATSEIAKSLYLEIAEDFIEYREKLQVRKQKLWGAMDDLMATEKKDIETDAAVVTFRDPLFTATFLNWVHYRFQIDLRRRDTMSEYKDFSDMIDVVTMAIEIQGRTGDSFRRYARYATSEVARSLYLEIAEEFIEYREKLQARKQKLLGAMDDLRAAKQKGIETNAAVNMVRDPLFETLENYTADMPRDPVCDMRVNAKGCQYVSVFMSEEYFFCCEDCQKAFDLSPAKYLKVKAGS